MARKKGPRSANIVDADVGNRIRAYRLEREMSQEQLGDKLGVSFQQVQKYEKGANRLSVGRMVEICKTFAVTPHDLIGWKKG